MLIYAVCFVIFYYNRCLLCVRAQQGVGRRCWRLGEVEMPVEAPWETLCASPSFWTRMFCPQTHTRRQLEKHHAANLGSLPRSAAVGVATAGPVWGHCRDRLGLAL